MHISKRCHSILTLWCPVWMIPESKSTLLFCFTKNLDRIIHQQFIWIRKENCVVMPRRHLPRNFRPFYNYEVMITCLFYSYVIRTISVRMRDVILMGLVFEMLC